jgi:hypothetical protein
MHVNANARLNERLIVGSPYSVADIPNSARHDKRRRHSTLGAADLGEIVEKIVAGEVTPHFGGLNY